MLAKFTAKHSTIIFLILFVLTIKSILFGWSYATFDFQSHPNEKLINIWDRWDAGVYKSIAKYAYAKTENMDESYWAFKSHFPPLYPTLIFILSKIGLTLSSAGIIISLASNLASSIILYLLVKKEFHSSYAATMSVVFLNLFPISYFTNSVYSEALFILCSVSSFYFLRRNNYLAASLLAAASILTRLVGVAVIPVYIVYVAFELYEKRQLKWHHLYLWLIPTLSVVLFMIINQIYYHHPLFFLKDAVSFNATKQLTIPFKETYADLIAIFQHGQLSNQEFMTARGWNAIFALFAVLVTTLGIKRMPWEYILYSYFSILVFASLSWGISNARYVFAVFPIFIMLGTMNNKFIQGILASLFFSGLLYFTTIFTSGGWGF